MPGNIQASHPDGHFYSPNLCIKDIEYCQEIRNKEIDLFDLPGLPLNGQEQIWLAQELSACYYGGPVDFPTHPTKDYRYYFENDSYSYSDAITLSAMIQLLKPKRIIEVGSGYSSMVTLDTIAKMQDNAKVKGEVYNCSCTFIEPYPDNLHRLLSSQQVGRTESVEIIIKNLQDVPLETFQQLDENDILFIDSTHVSKAGSDVNYLIHQIFPLLRKGVYIHIHDMFWPFQYPDRWMKGGISWNEQYMVRAFLEFNNSFEIAYFCTYLWHHHKDIMSRLFPDGIKNTGGNLWLRRNA